MNQRLGALEFAECIIHSFNYGDIKRNNDADDWDKTLGMMTAAALGLQNSGAAAIVLCANTMHLVACRLEQNINIPVIHIATATAEAIKAQKIRKVGMLGTRFTMERDFFSKRLEENGIEMIIPDNDDREFIHYTIFEEFGRGIFSAGTKERYLNIMDKLIAKGAEGIIAGCTEIPLFIRDNEVNFPLFNTLALHAGAAVEFALS